MDEQATRGLLADAISRLVRADRDGFRAIPDAGAEEKRPETRLDVIDKETQGALSVGEKAFLASRPSQRAFHSYPELTARLQSIHNLLANPDAKAEELRAALSFLFVQTNQLLINTMTLAQQADKLTAELYAESVRATARAFKAERPSLAFRS